MGEVECLVPAGDWTGEGAVWHEGEQALYWVDISRFLIHRYDPASRANVPGLPENRFRIGGG
jgi:sugar lactone lactonase YvrE